MKKLIVVGFIAVLLAGCASTEYRAYEGKEEIVQGVGGTKDVTDGVEFWMTGTPPHKYKVIGVASGAVLDSVRATKVIQSRIAEKVKAANGSAAILMGSQSNSLGGSGVMMGKMMIMDDDSKREMQFAIVKYLD